MKLFKLMIVPAMAFVVCLGTVRADEGLLGRMMQGKTAETKENAPTVKTEPVVENTMDNAMEKAAETQNAVQNEAKNAAPAGKTESCPKDGKTCYKGMKTCLDPTVEEFEEQVWVCQCCPCVVVVKKAGIASLHHCGKPMCLKNADDKAKTNSIETPENEEKKSEDNPEL